MERLTKKFTDRRLIVHEEERILNSNGVITKDEMYKIMRHLAEKLSEYEDLEEQGNLLIVPDIPRNKTLYWIWGNEIMPVTYKRIVRCKVCDDRKFHIVCEIITKKDRTFTYTYRRKPVETTIPAGSSRYIYADEIGKTVFLTRKEAKIALENIKERDLE